MTLLISLIKSIARKTYIELRLYFKKLMKPIMIQIIKPSKPKPNYKESLREYKESKKRNKGKYARG